MTIPTQFVSFQFTISGTVNNWTGQFVQNNDMGVCVSGSTNPVTCDGFLNNVPALITEPTNATTCMPATCLKSGCGQVPPALEMSYSVTGSGTNRVLTTVTTANTPLTTCTAQSMPNPVTFVWSPM